MKRVKKIAKFLLKIAIIGFITLFLLELVYRYQWIDFYSKEWRFQNDHRIKQRAEKNRILVFGDSFSADVDSWVNQWKNSKDTTIYNASFSGVGPETFRLIAKNRINEVKPTMVIVQLYVGNDLYDIHKPINWSKFAISRNLFFSVSNNFRVLNFINYRLGQASVEDASEFDPKVADVFSKEKYAARTKLYILGDNSYPQNMINIESSVASEFEDLTEMLSEMKNLCGRNVKFKVLIIPSCCHVAQRYVTQYRKLGSTISWSAIQKNQWSLKLRKAGFDVIDPLKELQKMETKGSVLFFENDPHLTENGQSIVMQFVKNQLK